MRQSFRITIMMQPGFKDDLFREQDRAFCVSVKAPMEKLTLNGSHQQEQYCSLNCAGRLHRTPQLRHKPPI